MIRKYAEIFCWKNVRSFCIAKATHIFSAKNIRILYIESAKTINETTLNELVKLMTLWTTGPWFLIIDDSQQYYQNFWNFKPVYSQPSLYRHATLRKHAYSNISKISSPKTKKISDKNPNIFHISVQNIDCGYSLEPPRRGGSNEYPQSILFSKIRKIMYTPVNPRFTI